MLVLPPDTEARAAILAYHLRGRPTTDLNFELLARASEGMSGADLQLVCEEATESALAAAIRTATMQPITTQQVTDAIRTTKPSTTAWFDSARNHVRYANDGGDYDELATYLKQRRSR
jgi:SpoVK/Ycf46/Vps4 family AAA+-type ATPase